VLKPIIGEEMVVLHLKEVDLNVVFQVEEMVMKNKVAEGVVE